MAHRCWQMLIPYEDKVDVITPTNIFFRESSSSPSSSSSWWSSWRLGVWSNVRLGANMFYDKSHVYIINDHTQTYVLKIDYCSAAAVYFWRCSGSRPLHSAILRVWWSCEGAKGVRDCHVWKLHMSGTFSIMGKLFTIKRTINNTHTYIYYMSI